MKTGWNEMNSTCSFSGSKTNDCYPDGGPVHL